MVNQSSKEEPIPKKYLWYIVVVFIILLGVIYFFTISNLRIWVLGAGALGLLSGYTTGASSQVGAGSEFLKFLSSGILLPLFGGIATLLSGSGNTTNTLSLDIIGGFLLFYGLSGIIGLILGATFKTHVSINLEK